MEPFLILALLLVFLFICCQSKKVETFAGGATVKEAPVPPTYPSEEEEVPVPPTYPSELEEVPVSPESPTQNVPIPFPETFAGNQPPNQPQSVEEGENTAPAESAKRGETIGAQGTILPFKYDDKVNMSLIRRFPNANIVYPSGQLAVEHQHKTEVECASQCHRTPKCGSYSYQPKQQVCWLYRTPHNLENHLEEAPTYQTGILNKFQL